MFGYQGLQVCLVFLKALKVSYLYKKVISDVLNIIITIIPVKSKVSYKREKRDFQNTECDHENCGILVLVLVLVLKGRPTLHTDEVT